MIGLEAIMKQCKLAGVFAVILLVWAAKPAGAQSSVPRTLGEIEVLSGPQECEDQQCYELQVTCPSVAAPARARLIVGAGEGEIERGTVLLTSVGPGTGVYGATPPSSLIHEDLRTSGFRTVRLQWIDSWGVGTPGEEEGTMRLACRPATVARWVYDNLHIEDSDTGFCASGHSGGAGQISFMLSHYGLDRILDAVVPTGGPPYARTDLSCMLGLHPGTTLVDRSLGYPPDGSGPCYNRDASYSERFRLASVASGEGDYIHPTTMVWFVFEGIDNGYAVAIGRTYLDLLVKQGSPLVEETTIPGVLHAGPNGLYNSQEGVARIRDILVNECRVRNP